MRILRSLCCALLCACLCFGLFSVSVSAYAVDGYDIVTSWDWDGDLVSFESNLTGNFTYEDEMTFQVDITLTEEIEKDTIFNVKVGFTFNEGSSISASQMAMYDKNWTLIDNTSAVIVDGNVVSVQDVQAAGNIKYLRFTIKDSTPNWIENIVEEKPPATYSFSINGVSYTMADGMTWAAWIDSDYNTLGVYSDESGVVYAPCGSPILYNNSSVYVSHNVLAGQSYVYELALIDFQIGGLEEQAIVNSTFGEWINSEYNVNGYFVQSSSGYILCAEGSKVYIVANTDGSYVLSGDVIEEGVSYKYYVYGNVSALSDGPTYTYQFTVLSVDVEEEDEQGLLSGIIGWIKNIYNGVINLPGNIANSLSGLFDRVVDAVNSLATKILDGIKGLFVPDAEAMADQQDKWTQLLEDRFGAVYESIAIVDEFASSFTAQDAQTTIEFPSVTIPLAGVDFVFGGWQVDVVPDGFEFLIEALKKIIDISCTFLFVSGMKRRLDHDILKG